MIPARFCPACGVPVAQIERGGCPRSACPRCGWVEWKNPKAAVAVILRDPQGRVLLVRRLAPPAGAWCIPCGNIEWEEEIRDAARRELQEETGLTVDTGRVYAVLTNAHDPEARSVGIWLLGTVVGGTEGPGGDADALGWFDPARPPELLAFPTDRTVLAALAAGKPEAVPDGPRGRWV